MDVRSRKQTEKFSEMSMFSITDLKIFSKILFAEERSVVADVFCDPCKFVNCCNKITLVDEI